MGGGAGSAKQLGGEVGRGCGKCKVILENCAYL